MHTKSHKLTTKNAKRLVTLTVAGILAFASAPLAVEHQKYYQANILQQNLVSMTNEVRNTLHIAGLKANPLLQKAALLKAQDMAKNDYFAHMGKDGKTLGGWIKQAGYKYLYAGENLAMNFNDNQKVTEAWLNSVKHRANILSDKFTEIGIGVADGFHKGKKTTYIAVMFGSPLPTAAHIRTIDLKKSPL